MPRGKRTNKPAKNRFARMRFSLGARTPVNLIEKAMSELRESPAAKKIILAYLHQIFPNTKDNAS